LESEAQQAGETVSTYIYKRHVLLAMANNMAGLSEPPKASGDGTITQEEQRSTGMFFKVRPSEKRQLKSAAQQAGITLSTYNYRVFSAWVNNMSGMSEPLKASGDRAIAPEEQYTARMGVRIPNGELIQLMREAQQAGERLPTYIRRVLSARVNNMSGMSEPPKASDEGAVTPKERRSARLFVSVRPSEKRQLKNEAKQAGLRLSTYIRRVFSARLNNMAGVSEPPKASGDGTIAPEERRSAEVMVRVRPREKRQLKSLAKQAKLTPSAYLRRILSAWLNNMAGMSEPPKASGDGTIAPEERRSAQLMVMIQPDEKRQLESKAQQAGLPLSTYMHRRLFGEGK
jgi:predicted HicB family RNase H-like nuclease